MIEKSEKEIMSRWIGDIDKPLVSIKCLAYNHRDYIESALDGFLMQETTFPFEIVVHDDASTDGTTEIIRLYEEKFPNIMKPIYETENQYLKRDGSLTKIVNSKLRGKFVAMCEGDDYWTFSNKLQKQCDYMSSHSECAMVYHAINYEKDGVIIDDDCASDQECDIKTEQIIEGGGMFCATASLFFRKDDGMIFPAFRMMADVGDYPLQVMLASMGKVHYYPEKWGVYRVASNGSWTNRKMNDSTSKIAHWNNVILWLSEFDSYTQKHYHNSIMSKLVDCYCQLRKLEYDDLDKLIEPIGLKDYLIQEEYNVASLKTEVNKKDVVIYGNPIIMNSICRWIKANQICKINCVCDNRELFNHKSEGYEAELCSIDEACFRFPNAIYIIASGRYYDKMEKQLIMLGIPRKNIKVKKNTFLGMDIEAFD